MRARRLLLLVGLAASLGSLTPGCLTTSAYRCEVDTQCVQGGAQGVCEAAGYCSFPDDGCASGKRYGEYAGDGLGGACVGDDSATASDGVTTSTSSSSASSTTDGCAPVGGACTGDDACCGPCSRCDQGACVIDVGAQGPCEPCFACDAGGACAPAAAGGACMFACDAIAWGTQARGDTIACLRGPAIEAPGSCDGAGACALTDPGACLGAPGAALFACAAACAQGRPGCTPGAAVDGLSLADLCVLEGTTAACGPGCADGAITARACDGAGLCVDGEVTPCSPYTCADDGLACKTQCMGKGDCADGFNCMAQICQ